MKTVEIIDSGVCSHIVAVGVKDTANSLAYYWLLVWSVYTSKMPFSDEESFYVVHVKVMNILVPVYLAPNK